MLEGYNERLFNGKSFRSKLHLARYIWLQKKIDQYKCSTEKILELGCFDGKSIEFLKLPPKHYAGYDANWEGGLDLAEKKWKAFPNYDFNYCAGIADFNPEKGYFDISVCQETLEHLPLADVDTYLYRMAMATNTYTFISVPNERGLVFLGKRIGKMLTQDKNDLEKFTVPELFYASIGKTKKVKRRETGHKGFDHLEMEKNIKKYFDIVETNALPFGAMPVSMNFTVAYVCKRKATL